MILTSEFVLLYQWWPNDLWSFVLYSLKHFLLMAWFFFLTYFLRRKNPSSVCPFCDPPNQGFRWKRRLSLALLEGFVCVGVGLFSKLIMSGYFLTGENVNITQWERCDSPRAAFLFMSFNSINGLLGRQTVVFLLYLCFFISEALQRNATTERSAARGFALLPFAKNVIGVV